MTKRLAIIAGEGRLPDLLAEAEPSALMVRFGKAAKTEVAARLEHIGQLFERLTREGITHCVMAGAMARPKLDPTQFDEMANVVLPELAEAMDGGDDALLRRIIDLFEDQGMRVVGAHQVRPDLVVPVGLLAGHAPTPRMIADAALGTLVLNTLSPLDIGQAVVCARGRVLAIETAFGTKDMLKHLTGRAAGGVLSKRAKVGQDLRVDMPTIGPETVDQANAARLAGIALEARRVLVVDRADVITKAEAAHLSIWAS